MRGTELQWYKTYLKGRQQHTTVNSSSSKNVYINYGVPERSVLGPLLFLVYINGLNKAIKYSDVHHFPDDTKKSRHLSQTTSLINIQSNNKE